MDFKRGGKSKMKQQCSGLRWIISTVLLTTVFLMTSFESTAQAGEKRVYRQKWLLNISVVGDLYAWDHGFYAEQGLDILIKPGGPERDAIRELELGSADFGVASADQVIRARAKGAPVVVIAQLFQVNPLQWIYRDTRPEIKHLHDLKGLTIGITYGGNDETIMRTLLTKANLSEKDVTLFSVRYDYTPFYRKKADIWPVYRNAQGPILAAKLAESGEKVRFFNPANFGLQFVANSVVTSRRMLDENPETVKKFIAALLKGWREAIKPANKEAALKTIQTVDADTPYPVLEQQLDITRALIQPNPDIPVGTIDVQAWKQTEAIMVEQGQISAPIGIQEALTQQF
jgi:NitT/TauT family transport system substrate-binding protein